MVYSKLLTEFHGRRVVDFDNAENWEGPDVVYRVREDYEDERSIGARLESLLEQPEVGKLTGLIIGAWGEAYEGDGVEPVAKALLEAAPKLAALRAMFFAEMTYDECEISWINNTDMSPLLAAFPKLETLRVRGSNGLAFAPIEHDGLTTLAVESGGLPRAKIRQIFQCKFPHLTRLELLLGEENYGFDGSVEDLQPLLSGKLFPKLKHLGLMNSIIADDIAAVIVNSPIVERLESLDLSLGNLDGEGVKSLHGLAAHKNLKQLNISHYYASPAEVDALIKALPFKVIADSPQERDDEWRPIMHAE